MYVFSDIDECLLYPCGDYATCENINNGYICTCDYGYAKNDNQICEGITQFWKKKHISLKVVFCDKLWLLFDKSTNGDIEKEEIKQ